jgi:hypothetical protein
VEIGYALVSTRDQYLDLQLNALLWTLAVVVRDD